MSEIDPRHAARALALQELFTTMVTKHHPINPRDLLEELDIEEYNQELKEKIVKGVTETKEQLDPIIQELAPAWPLDQIAPVDLTILRIGLWEGFVGKITPVKVAVNEAVELAKQFGGSNSGSFVNGVLGALVIQNKKQRDEQGK